jgi:hypothetical protein
MQEQFGNFVGGYGQTVNDLPSYAQTQQDMGAIRELMGQQGAGYMVTGNASMADGGNSAAYLPGMMNQAGIAPTQGILNSYQQITGQQYRPGDTITGYNNYGNGGTYGIRGANGQTSQSAMTGYGGFAGQPAQSFGTKPMGMGDTNMKQPMQMGGGSAFGGGSATSAPGMQGQAGSPNGMGAFGSAPSQPGQAGGMGSNPYLSQMGDVMAGQMTQNFNRRVMPQISSQMMATGGFGGSRQGVIEANAMNDLNQQIGSGLTNLYGQGYNTDRQYDLGLRNNDLGFAGLDAQINQNNFNNRLNGANFGLGMYDRLQQGNQTGINAGTNIQNTPMNYWSQFGNQYNSIGQGYGTTTGSTNQQGNPLMGALGGAQLGSRIGNMWGGSPNAAGGSNSSGFGTGSGFGNQDLGSFF